MGKSGKFKFAVFAILILVLVFSVFYLISFMGDSGDSKLGISGNVIYGVATGTYNSLAKIVGFVVEAPAEEVEEVEEEKEEKKDKEKQAPSGVPPAGGKQNLTEEIIDETEQTNLTDVNDTKVTEIINETGELEEINDTLTNVTDVVANLTEENLTEVNISEGLEQDIVSEADVNISVKQYRAVINRPVKWLKIISVKNKTNIEESNLSVEIPKQSENITVKTGEEVQEALQDVEEYGDLIESVGREDLVSEIDETALISSITGNIIKGSSMNSITGNVALDISNRKNVFAKFWGFVKSITITGHVIEESELDEEIIETEDSKVIDVGEIINQTGSEDVAIEYYTEAPIANETNVSAGTKRIIVSADDDLNYSEILAYTLLDKPVPMGELGNLKLYWYASVEDAVKYGYVNVTNASVLNISEINLTEIDEINVTEEAPSGVAPTGGIINETDDEIEMEEEDEDVEEDEVELVNDSEAVNESEEVNEIEIGIVGGGVEEVAPSGVPSAEGKEIEEEVEEQEIEEEIEEEVEEQEVEEVEVEEEEQEDVEEEIEIGITGSIIKSIRNAVRITGRITGNIIKGVVGVTAKVIGVDFGEDDIEINKSEDKDKDKDKDKKDKDNDGELILLDNQTTTNQTQIPANQSDDSSAQPNNLSDIEDDIGEQNASLFNETTIQQQVNDLLNITKTPTPEGIKIEVNYTGYDFDGDGYVDYIEWVVPHLSVQTYEITVLGDESVLSTGNITIENNTYSHLTVDDGDSDDVYLEFDGDGDYVETSETETYNFNGSTVTVSMWVNPNDLGDIPGLWSIEDLTGGNEYMKAQSSSTNMDGFIYDGVDLPQWDINLLTNLQIGVWDHLVWVISFNSSSNWNVTGYQNGIFAGSDAGNEVISFTGDFAVLIGKNNNMDANSSIDSVRIYNTSLNQANITEIYNSGRGANSSLVSDGLVGLWEFDEGAGTNATDSSGEGNDGTLNGDTKYNSWGLGDNLVLYMPSDVNDTESNITYDFSKEDNDGTVTGNPVWSSGAGVFGGAYEFDGDGDYVDCGTSLQMNTSDYTLGAWIKTNSTSVMNIVGWHDSYPITYISLANGDLSSRIGYNSTLNTATTYASSLDDGNWHLVIVTFDRGGNMLKYIDGIWVQNTDISSNNGFDLSSTKLTIASHGAGAGGNYFNGSIDEVMIFNTSLTAQQVKGLYENSSARFRDAGVQTLKFQNITAGQDNIELSATYQSNEGSNLSARAGYWDVSLGYNESDFVGEDSLVGYWHFDESNLSNGSTLEDFSGHCYDNETEILSLVEVDCGDEWDYTLSGHTLKGITHRSQARTCNAGENLQAGVEYCEEDEEEKEDLVGLVVMNKVFKDDFISFNFEYEDKTSNLDSFVVTQSMPEIFEMLNSSFITGNNLSDFFIYNNGEIFVFSRDFIDSVPQFIRKLEFESHFNPDNLSNSSKVISECGPFSISFNSLTKDSFSSNSSIGYQSILSQNSWSPSDKVLVLENLSEIFCFINLTTALTKNSESNFCLGLISSAILTDNNENEDYLSFSVDDKNKKCYKEEWKLFADLKDDERVMTLNDETGEGEWQLPSERQVFDNFGEMYKIVLDDGRELVVSEEHRVYSSSSNSSIRSAVVNTSISDCSLKCLSLDQIEQLNLSAVAKYCMSSGSGQIESDCLRNDSISGLDINDSLFLKIKSTLESSCSERCVFDNISDLYFSNSINKNSGAISSSLSERNNSAVFEFLISAENKMLASTTSCIYCSEDALNFLDNSLFSFLPNSNASSSVKSLSLVNSCNTFNCDAFRSIACLATADQFMICNSSIVFFNSSGTDNVSVGILLDLFNVFNTHNTGNALFKSFDSKDLSDFSLEQVTETYSRFENGDDVYFLTPRQVPSEEGNSENDEVRVKSITRENYSGKIYDVDVGNDIVLVRKGDVEGVWSGNSNNGTVYSNASGGGDRDISNANGVYSRGGDFDGDGDWVDVGNDESLNLTDGMTLLVWLKYTNTGLGSNAYIITKNEFGGSGSNRAYILHADSYGKFSLIIHNSSGTSFIIAHDENYHDGNWHHVVGTWEPDNLVLYVDGILVNSTITIGGFATSTNSVRIGGWDGTYRPFNGSIDEVMIFNRSLSEDEIKQLYTSGRAKWAYSDYSLFDGSGSDEVNLTIGTDATHILPEFKFDVGTYDFYSPILEASSLNPMTLNVSEVTAPTLTVNSPNNDSNWNTNDVVFNASATDSNNVSVFNDYGLVSWWRMDDANSSTVFDYMGRNNGSVEGNAVQTDAGKMGKGFEFDGAGDWVDCGNGERLNITDAITISAWVYPIGPVGDMYYIVGKKLNGYPNTIQYGLQIDYTTIDFILGNSSTTFIQADSSTTISHNVWHNIIGTWDKNGDTLLHIYIDGSEASYDFQANRSIDIFTTTANLLIGMKDLGLNRDFNGTIDDVMIFNRSLSAEEIQGLYANTSSQYLNTSINIPEGTNDVTFYSQDVGGNVASQTSYNVSVDVTLPTLTVNSPLNASYNSSSVLINVSSSESGSGFIVPNLDSSLVSWWRMDDVNGSGDVVDYMHCYDDETKILTDEGWKLFSELEDDEMVMTLNSETGEAEYQEPFEKQIYDYRGEMYKIETSEGDLVVSPEHKVYSSKKSLSSDVVNTSIIDCSLKCESSDQSGQFSFSDNAKYCLSSGSDNNEFAQFNCCGETLIFKLTNFDNISFILSNLSSEILSNSQSSLECSSNSSKINLCEYKSNECLCDNFLVNEPFFNSENAMLASMTSFIYLPLDSFANLSLTSLANFKQSSSVNLLSFVSSSSSSNNSAFSSCLITSCLASSDQFTQDSSFISSLTSLGTEKVTDAIYSLLPSNLFNCSTFEDIILLNISDHLILGCLSILDFNSSEIDNVTVAIFNPLGDSVCEHNYVETYKSFGSKDLSDFSLEQVTETYSRFEQGEALNGHDSAEPDVYFLNENNEPVRVLGIEKVDYSGKIYDVDVGNDIVLVSRGPRRDDPAGPWFGVWSGNSNNGSVEGDAKQVDNGKMGKGFEFDGVGDYVDCGNDDSLNITGSISVTAWIKADSIPTWTAGGSFLNDHCSNTGFYMMVTSGDALFVVSNGTSVNVVQTSIQTGQWYHIVGTYNSTTHKIYLDGSEIQSESFGGGLVSCTSQIFAIGSDNDGGTIYPFNGSIDEVMIFNKSLTSDEILAIYNATKLEFSEAGLTEGSHTFDVYTSDTAGNVVSEFKSFEVDVTNPSLTVNSPNNDSNWNTNDVVFNASATDSNNVSVFNDYGLVSWWRMDDANSSTVFDYMGRNNGSVEGDAVQVDNGKMGKGFEFDGAGDYVDCGNITYGFSNGFTVLAWIKTPDLVETRSIVGIDDASTERIIQFRIGNTGAFRLIRFDGANNILANFVTTKIIDDNSWHHVVATFDTSDGSKLYVDGIVNATDSNTTANNDGGEKTFIGARDSTSIVDYFNGTIDDVMIFNRSLSAEEIQGLYANTSSQYLNTSVSILEGTRDVTFYSQDIAGNIKANEVNSVTVDTGVPGVEFGGGTNANASTIARDNIFVNVSASDSLTNVSTFIDFDNSLVSWWRMDDLNSSGGVVDYMGRNNGSVEGDAVQTDAGKMGKGFEFDGDGDYVDCGNNLFNNNSVSSGTVSAWVKSDNLPSASANMQFIFDNEGQQISLAYWDGSKSVFRAHLYDGSAHYVTGTTSLSLGAWYHYVEIWNGTTIRMFVNGVEEGTPASSNSPNVESVNRGVMIGVNWVKNNYYWNGTIDDVVIFNRSLSAEEIQGLYANQTSKYFDVNFTSLEIGNHTFTSYTQDSAGNVNATAERSVGIVNVSSGDFSGDTTDFSEEDDLGNISSLTIDSPNYGLINFSESVDLSGGADINEYVNVSQNRIEINSSGLPALNKSARLSLYNLTYTNPRVLKDGSVCSDCTEVSYSGGTFIFDVTEFSIYSAGETPVTTTDTTSGGSSGGGGGGVAVPIVGADFSLDTENFKIRSVVGDLKSREFTIENTGEVNLNARVSVSGQEIETENGDAKSFDKVIVLDKESFSLDVGAKEKAGFKIIAPETLGVYTGKIIVRAGGITKEILITINTQSKETLFDISSTLMEEDIRPGDKIRTQMYLLPVGEKGVDVTIKYLIKDFKGKVYYEESSTFYVDEEMSFLKEFDSDKLPLGDYVLAAEMVYIGGFASASSQFEVMPSGHFLIGLNKTTIAFIIIGLVILIFIIVLVKLIKIKKYKKAKR